MITDKKKYIMLISFIIILIIVIFLGCIEIKCAYVKTTIVTDGWNENTALRNTGIQFLGLEKWCSSTYEINGKYPASLTVTTLKSLVLIDEKEIKGKTRITIEETFENNINLEENNSGYRLLKNNHKSLYIIYDGFDVKKEENIKLICEIWNCGDSGTSIICIGFAYITNIDILDSLNYDNWQKIVQDQRGTIDGYIGEEGLIDNIYCH